jgi:hypothetical protein
MVLPSCLLYDQVVHGRVHIGFLLATYLGWGGVVTTITSKVMWNLIQPIWSSINLYIALWPVSLALGEENEFCFCCLLLSSFLLSFFFFFELQ